MTHTRNCEGLSIDAPTPLMCVEVAAVVPPYHQALLRCAGSVGVDVYEEVVARGKAPLYIENTHKDGGKDTNRPDEDDAVSRRVPTTLPITTPLDIEPRDLDTAVLVITHGYLERCGMTLSELNVPHLQRMRYVGCGREVEPGLRNGDDPSISKFGDDINRGKWRSIEFCGVENVRQIPHCFMSHCTPLTSIDMSLFHNVTEVGDGFMYLCTSLTSIDLSPFSNVTKVGGYFLAHCYTLTSVDLSPLSNVTTVGMGFICAAASLTSLDLSPMVNVASVEMSFLTSCQALTTIDLIPFRNFNYVPVSLMGSCSSLIVIDLSPFRNVTEVAPCFLTYCTSLTTIDLEPFANVTTVGLHFMNNCTALTSIDLGPFANVTTIGVGFLGHCTSLVSIDLSPLVSLTTTLDKTFMIKCKALKPAMRKQFMQAVEDRKNGVVPVAPATPVAARKVGVKAGGKKTK